MKAFTIKSKPAIAVITAALSLSIEPKVSIKKRQVIIQKLQLVMFLNFKKYGVHVLEEDTFLYEGISAIKQLEDEEDICFIIESEVEVKKEEEVSKNSVNFSSFMEALLSVNEVLENGQTNQDKMKAVLAGIRSGLENKDEPGKPMEKCLCPRCTELREKKESNLQKKK